MKSTNVVGLILSPEKFEVNIKNSLPFSFQLGQLLFTLFKDAGCKLSGGIFCGDRAIDLAKKNQDKKVIELMNFSQPPGHIMIDEYEDEDGKHFVDVHDDCICSRWSKKQWFQLIQTAKNFLEQNSKWKMSEGVWMKGETDYEIVSGLLKTIEEWMDSLKSEQIYLSEKGKAMPISELESFMNQKIDRDLCRKTIREIIADK